MEKRELVSFPFSPTKGNHKSDPKKELIPNSLSDLAHPRTREWVVMSVARPLLRALLRAESAWRRAAREAMQRSASAATAAASASPSPASATSSSLEPDQGASSAPDALLLRFREPMDTLAWQRGRHGWALGGESYHLEAARASLGGSNGGGSLPLGPPSSGTFRGTQLRCLILSNFRAAEAAFKQGFSDLSAAEDAGFAALRALGEQRAMERCSSDSACANGVRVEATAALVAALPCSPSSSSSRAFVSGSGSMRSVTSAGPGVIVITSVQEGSSDEDEDEEEGDDDEDSDDDSRVRRAAASSPPPPSSSSSAPEMRYVFTYRLRITNTNPPLPDEDDEEGEEEGGDDEVENGDEAGGGEEDEEEKGGAAAAAAAVEAAETWGGGATPGLRVQLLTRGWQIRDSSGRLHAAVPKGSPGVVGCTPVLSPGETFEYYSSTDLPTPAGVMSGSFGMTVVGVGGGGGGGGSSAESGRSKRRRKRKASPPAPLLSTVASRRFDAVVAPFALRADPLKR